MSVTLVGGENRTCRLVFDGSMTFTHARELEDRVIEAMRRYEHLEIDLGGVEEIDIFGIHLLGLLQGVGGNDASIVSASPVVEQASARLLSSPRRAWLRGDRRERAASRVEVGVSAPKGNDGPACFA